METHFKGINTLPAILMNMAKTSWEGFFELHQQWIEKAGKVGESTKAFKLESLDEDAFRMWTELYGKEFSQILNIPQIGLMRFYQERMYRFMDKYNIFQTKMAKFMHLLYLPVEKSFKVMQERLTELAEEEKLPDDSKTYYQMWIKALEGNYMTFFQSPEYTQTMHQTLDSLAEFSASKKEFLQDMLSIIPVPTQQEMDELYKEIYLLKKKVNVLEKEKANQYPKSEI
jgi:class III poly(R)-hydroxyalkanoic acid synthase PhaE subunit